MRPSHQIKVQESGNAACGAAGKYLGSGKVGSLERLTGLGIQEFSTWAGKGGGMLSPGCQEKQDTLQEQNSESIFISSPIRGNI